MAKSERTMKRGLEEDESLDTVPHVYVIPEPDIADCAAWAAAVMMLGVAHSCPYMVIEAPEALAVHL